MVKQSSTPPASVPKMVTAERAARLYRMIRLLEGGPQTRSAVMRRLRVDVRSFYRDLESLRAAGITLKLRNQRYELDEPISQAMARLPFPDPHLTFGDMTELARGSNDAHRKLRQLIEQITSL